MNPLNAKQFGFTQQISTTVALTHALDTTKRAKEQKLQVIAVSLDIKAAFDNAWWPAIFHRLRLLNCPSNIFHTLNSDSTNRKAKIDFTDTTAQKTFTKYT